MSNTVESKPVYITQSNATSIVYKVGHKELLNLEGEMYTKPILILSNMEKQRLLALRNFFEAPELFIEEYYDVARTRVNKDLVFVGKPPAYHTHAECERLRAEYLNYEIPQQIKDKEETEPGIKERFRQWFKENQYLLDESNPRYKANQASFILRIRADFKVDIRDIRQIVLPNSGFINMENSSLEDIQAEIDKVLKEAGRWYYKDTKNTVILKEYQKKTYLAYKDNPLPENTTGYADAEVKAFLKDYDARFKKPLKIHLTVYYRMRYNRNLSFNGKLLDQVGFLPCRQCHQPTEQ